MKFEEAFENQLKIEEEKKIFGGNIYAMSHSFPSLYITKNKEDENNNLYCIEKFNEYTKLVNIISDNSGKDIILLFAEICKLYEIENENIDKKYNDINKQIIEFCTKILGHLAIANTQSKKILEAIDFFKKGKELSLEINGPDYCFIVIAFNNLLFYYKTLIDFIAYKKHLESEFIHSISRRFSLIESNEFESIKRMFKVSECYEKIEETPTIH